ncbi:MAG: dTDP-4-dehydrorhamnose 3,5-epimerase [Ignavibacteriae bacterium HGW-Ignavibacteriae-1]|jgi:dTDP-4-dehydrorhamnose 3,5-epimerase|nr:MAG: dTDP-4-dehydrorhamnose 3,5-epimerase [Ignavibacteriae bacterium HGW-Ignavibacteriae-1]
MKITQVNSLTLSELKLIQFARFGDERGYFTETFRQSDFENNAKTEFLAEKQFKQINESYTNEGFFRGLHFQWNPFMDKLVRCVNGHIIDFALDIRPESPNFCKIVAQELKCDYKSELGEWFWVPNGFAHGFYALEDSLIEYMCTSEWSQGHEASLTIADDQIDWSNCEPDIIDLMHKRIKNKTLKMSNKDKMGMNLSQWADSIDARLFKYEA